jgi:CheY-like chemotaxis protein
MSFKLLVVVGALEDLNAVQGMLQSLGYEVLALSDSRQAQVRIDREKFSAAFIEAHMPHVDGCALSRQIRNSPSNSTIPIVLFTSHGDFEATRAGLKAGATFFVSKPLELEELSGLMRAIQGAMLREKRRYLRLPLYTAISCPVGQSEFDSSALDISEGGILLEGGAKVATGIEVELHFCLRGAIGMLRPACTVVRRDLQGRMAVRYTKLEGNERKAIQGYIAGIVRAWMDPNIKSKSRRYERTAISVPVKLVVSAGGQSTIHKARMIDLSARGVRIETDAVLTPNQIVELVPGDKPKHPTRGRVVWIDPPQAGIEILDASAENAPRGKNESKIS